MSIHVSCLDEWNDHAQTTIDPHVPFLVNRTYDVYLSNYTPPNIIFISNLDDYVKATLLIQQMNKQDELVQPQAYAGDTKLLL
jgi:hypothetical protein